MCGVPYCIHNVWEWEQHSVDFIPKWGCSAKKGSFLCGVVVVWLQEVRHAANRYITAIIRGTIIFQKPKIRTNSKAHCLLVREGSLWNSSPEGVKSCRTLGKHKRPLNIEIHHRKYYLICLLCSWFQSFVINNNAWLCFTIVYTLLWCILFRDSWVRCWISLSFNLHPFSFLETFKIALWVCKLL